MAARFQRLDNSEDITSPEIQNTYNSNFYDEPSNIYSGDDQRRMSRTTRKPVSNSFSPPPQTYSQSPPQPYYQSQYQSPNLNQTPNTAQEQPLMPNYHTANSRQDSMSSYTGQSDNPFRDPPRRHARESLLTKTISQTASSIWSKARGHHVSHIATPLWAAPWRHQLCPDLPDAKTSTVRAFDRVKQRNRIFFHFFLLWLVPVAFCGALVGVLYAYSSQPQVSKHEKYMFNALVVGFSLCLGFAVVNGMKEYASILRWRLLARRYRSLQEFELLLGLASQKKATRLLWVARTEGSIVPNGTQLLCFSYLVLMVGLQILIALLGLCYSVDNSLLNYDLIKGDVSIAKLDNFQQADYVNDDVDPFQLQSAAINAYGIAGQGYGVNYQSNTSQVDWPIAEAQPLYTDNQTLWWYKFQDQCPGNECTTSYITKRWISASAVCRKYTVISGGFVDDKKITFNDETGKTKYFTYFGSETSATTTWYANTETSCGNRCTTLFAINIGWEDSKGKIWHPQIFQCNNTISTVNGTEAFQNTSVAKLPDEQARLVAGAIGYNGESFSNLSYQARTYDVGSLWSWTHMNGVEMTAPQMANLAMHYSMGAVAGLDLQAYGPREITFGDSPVPAQQVNVEWKWAILVLILVPGIQFLVLLVAVAWGNAAVIRDDSFLAAASLLRPIIEKLDRTGCALTSDEICEVLGNPNVAYGVRMPQASAYGGMMKGNEEVLHLDILAEHEQIKGQDLNWRVGLTMPQGRYDGLKKVEKEEQKHMNSAITTATAIDNVAKVLRKRRKSF